MSDACVIYTDMATNNIPVTNQKHQHTNCILAHLQVLLWHLAPSLAYMHRRGPECAMSIRELNPELAVS
jgi:hypothetical protein